MSILQYSFNMKSTIEKFKDIPGYEGLYQVSDCGTVRSLKYGKVKYLKNKKRHTGYEIIGLYRDGIVKHFLIHRLVYEAFVGGIPEGYEIDHVNTVRDDNRLVNLRVVTSKENSNNYITAARNREAGKRRSQDQKWLETVREGIKRRSQDPKWRKNKRKANAKPILQINKSTGEIIRRWECARDIERELGINNSNISKCCLGKYQTAGGFKWKFA